MGMAASQARFLMLTARKSNVEYEGQQVNQQRTALANESANLYNQLSSIKVPTPPTTSDYYETVYTFKTSELDHSGTGATEYTLNNIYSTPDGTYANLTYNLMKWESAISSAYAGSINAAPDEKGNMKYSVSLSNGLVKDAVEYSYEPAQAKLKLNLKEELNPEGELISQYITIDNKKYTLKGNTLTDGTKEGTFDVVKNADGTYTATIVVQKDPKEAEPYYYTIGGVKYKLTDNGDGTYSCAVPDPSKTDPVIEEDDADVNGKYVSPDGKANSAVNCLDEGFTTSKGFKNQPILAYTINDQVYFISSTEFESGMFNSSSYVQQVPHPTKVDYPCVYSTAANGRYQTLTVTDDYGFTHTFDLNVTTHQDEAAYEQAMLDYQYEQSKYQKKVQDINSKTEALQQEDRTLELRLKQLDTEQNAIKTEMDAVKKVIEDNVESTFKTFA